MIYALMFALAIQVPEPAPTMIPIGALEIPPPVVNVWHVDSLPHVVNVTYQADSAWLAHIELDRHRDSIFASVAAGTGSSVPRWAWPVATIAIGVLSYQLGKKSGHEHPVVVEEDDGQPDKMDPSRGGWLWCPWGLRKKGWCHG